MRTFFTSAFLILVLSFAVPASHAQMRADAQRTTAPAQLYGQSGPSFSLNKLFSPEHFRMQQSFEMSSSSFGGQSASLAMYTNTMMWQFNQKLAARVDVSYAMSPFGGNNGAFGFSENNQGRVFVRNAEVAYKPKENMTIHFSYRQSPYGPYANPYGAFGGYGHRDPMSRQSMFWNN